MQKCDRESRSVAFALRIRIHWKDLPNPIHFVCAYVRMCAMNESSSS